MQVGTDIGNEGDGYRLTVRRYSGRHVGIPVGNERDRYRLTIGGYDNRAFRKSRSYYIVILWWPVGSRMLH